MSPARHLALLLALSLTACADPGTMQRELESAQGRLRLAAGDLGPPQDEAASRAAELPAGARRHRPGDRLRYSDGRTWTVTAVEGAVVAFSDDRGHLTTASVNPAFPPFLVVNRRQDIARETGGDPPTGLWPLADQRPQVYNTIRRATERATGATSTSRARLECRAEAPATVQGPLGAYGTVPVTCRVFGGPRLDQRAVQTWDMVPELGHWVRRVETDLRGTPRAEVWLVGIEPGPWLAAATRERIGAVLRSALETLPSGRGVAWEDRQSGLGGLVMATATFAPERNGTVCRAYTLTIVENGTAAVDYPGRSCRRGDGWQLPEGF